jgi:hypothetical protein
MGRGMMESHMSIEFKWDVTAAPFYPEWDGKSHVVYALFWQVTASDGEADASDTGCVGLDLTFGKFTPYSDLTRDQVVAWAKTALGADVVKQIEAHLIASLAAAKTPPAALPWDLKISQA